MNTDFLPLPPQHLSTKKRAHLPGLYLSLLEDTGGLIWTTDQECWVAVRWSAKNYQDITSQFYWVSLCITLWEYLISLFLKAGRDNNAIITMDGYIKKLYEVIFVKHWRIFEYCECFCGFILSCGGCSQKYWNVEQNLKVTISTDLSIPHARLSEPALR